MVEALDPMYAVPGHRQAEEIDGVWHLAATTQYIQDFGKTLEKKPRDPKDVVSEMLRRTLTGMTLAP